MRFYVFFVCKLRIQELKNALFNHFELRRYSLKFIINKRPQGFNGHPSTLYHNPYADLLKNLIMHLNKFHYGVKSIEIWYFSIVSQQLFNSYGLIDKLKMTSCSIHVLSKTNVNPHSQGSDRNSLPMAFKQKK